MSKCGERPGPGLNAEQQAAMFIAQLDLHRGSGSQAWLQKAQAMTAYAVQMGMAAPEWLSRLQDEMNEAEQLRKHAELRIRRLDGIAAGCPGCEQCQPCWGAEFYLQRPTAELYMARVDFNRGRFNEWPDGAPADGAFDASPALRLATTDEPTPTPPTTIPLRDALRRAVEQARPTPPTPPSPPTPPTPSKPPAPPSMKLDGFTLPDSW